MASIKSEIRDINILLKKGDAPDSERVEPALDWFKLASPHAQAATRNRLFNLFLDTCRLDLVGPLGEFKLPYSTDTGILLIRYHLADDRYSEALKCFENTENPRKKNASLLLSFLLAREQYADAAQFYHTQLLPKFSPDESDLAGFLRKSVPDDIRAGVLDTLLGQPLSVAPVLDVPALPYDPTWGLKKIKFTAEQREYLLKSLSTVFKAGHQEKAYHRILEDTRDYDYVIDAANVICFIDRKFTETGFRRLVKVVHALRGAVWGREPRILVVLHERHFKRQSRGIKEACSRLYRNPCVTIVKTPHRFNDDYYSLLNAISRDTLLVTNDQFRDHVFAMSRKEGSLNLLTQWRQEMGVEYDQIRSDSGGPSQIVLKHPPEYSYRIQKITEEDGGVTYYVPCQEQKWHAWRARAEHLNLLSD